MNYDKRWYPERFFYSHATSDDRLTAIVKDILEGHPERFEVYVAERGMVGRPLMNKLRDELLNCNAVIVGWTTDASTRSSEIISFEVGMAFSLGLPIYILCSGCLNIPWFFSHLCEYAKISDISVDAIRTELSKIEPFSFFHPVDLIFPAESEPNKGQSQNLEVIQQNGTIALPAGFNDILHFNVINRRQQAERNVRITLRFPNPVIIEFDPGSRDGSSGVQRNEMFDMWQAPPGLVRMYWSSMPLETFSFELRLVVPDKQTAYAGKVECRVSSDSVVGWRLKYIPLIITGETAKR